MGGGMAAVGGLFAFGQQNFGRALGYALLIDIGAVLLALGLGTSAGVVAALTALTRGAQAGLADAKRVAVLYGASRFDRQYPGQTAYGSLGADAGGLPLALDNLVLAGAPFIEDVVKNWSTWQTGVPR